MFPRKKGAAMGAGVGITDALVSAKAERKRVEMSAKCFMVVGIRNKEAARLNDRGWR